MDDEKYIWKCSSCGRCWKYNTSDGNSPICPRCLVKVKKKKIKKGETS